MRPFRKFVADLFVDFTFSTLVFPLALNSFETLRTPFWLSETCSANRMSIILSLFEQETGADEKPTRLDTTK